jgi:hypothetical protein
VEVPFIADAIEIRKEYKFKGFEILSDSEQAA